MKLWYTINITKSVNEEESQSSIYVVTASPLDAAIKLMDILTSIREQEEEVECTVIKH